MRTYLPVASMASEANWEFQVVHDREKARVTTQEVVIHRDSHNPHTPTINGTTMASQGRTAAAET
jgi:hypothetical protein